MQKYKQYCPVARASEILADRWTPLIVRELILGSHRFNEIERGLPGISRSLLTSRLRELEDAGVVERLPGAQPKVTAYHLSEAGRELKTVIEALGAWGVRWAFGEPQARGAGRRAVDLADSPADQSRAAAGTANGGGVRLHRTSRAAGVAAARAPGGLGLRDAARVRLRSRRPGGSGVLLPCLAGTHRLRRGDSLPLGRGGRAALAGETASTLVHVEPDGALRSGTLATRGAAGLNRLSGYFRASNGRSITLSSS